MKVLFESEITPSERRLRGRTRLLDEAVERLRKAYNDQVPTRDTETFRIVLETDEVE